MNFLVQIYDRMRTTMNKTVEMAGSLIKNVEKMEKMVYLRYQLVMLQYGLPQVFSWYDIVCIYHAAVALMNKSSELNGEYSLWRMK